MSMRLKTYMVIGLLFVIMVLIAGSYHELIANTAAVDHQQVTIPDPLPVLTPANNVPAPAHSGEQPTDLNALPNPYPFLFTYLPAPKQSPPDTV